MSETYLIYIDDSGNEKVGTIFSAVVFASSAWTQALDYWIGLRRELAEPPCGLPSFFEIHSHSFVSLRPLKETRKDFERREKILAARADDPVLQSVALARAQIELGEVALSRSIEAAIAAGRRVDQVSAVARVPEQDVEDRLSGRDDPGVLEKLAVLAETGGARSLRFKAFQKCVDQIPALPSVRIFTAHTEGSSGLDRTALYSRLLTALDQWLAEKEGWGVVIVDGTPSARTLYYREAHRALKLATRRILEDEVIRDSSESHFIQMADIVAHSAHRLLTGHPANYLQFAKVVVTPDGAEPSPEAPGFFP